MRHSFFGRGVTGDFEGAADGARRMGGNSPKAERRGSAKAFQAIVCFWLLLACGPAFPQSPDKAAWDILQGGVSARDSGRRAAAVGVLAWLPGDTRAVECAEYALNDRKPLVRAAAAHSLGELGAVSAIPALKRALADKDSRVSFAAADALILLEDSSGYDLYYEVLIGERKVDEGLITDKKRLLADPRQRNLLALGVAAGFAPYAGYGWIMWQELSRDYASPVRIRALRKLAQDPDPRIGGGLLKAAFDKHATVRIAALAAIARHNDPSLGCGILPLLRDKKPAVRYAAAAAILRLSAIAPLDCSPPDAPALSGP